VQLVSRVERVTAALPAGNDPSPMSSDLTPATRTFRYPSCRRSDNRAITAAGTIATQFLCFGFPHSAVTMPRPYQGVCNLVEDCVSDFRLGVQEGESLAERDRPDAVHAESKSSHRPVEFKIPMRKTVLGHRLLGESFGVFQNHWWTISQRYSNDPYFFNGHCGEL